jgi:hypothetical protein
VGSWKIALIIIGIAIYNLARAMPVKTHRGAEEAAKWLTLGPQFGNPKPAASAASPRLTK